MWLVVVELELESTCNSSDLEAKSGMGSECNRWIGWKLTFAKASIHLS